nr:MAG TPA: Flagellar and Swarming motility protein [Caudoviricetes sp.]
MPRLIALTDVAGNVRLFNPDHIVDVVYVEGLGHTRVYIDVSIEGANYVAVKEALEQVRILVNGY